MSCMKLCQGLIALVLVSFALSCGENQLRYHTQRQQLVKTKRVEMFDLCNHYDRTIRRFCKDEFGIKRAKHLFDFIRDHVPEDYFDPNAPEDYFVRDENKLNINGPFHLRPRVEVTAILEDPASKANSLNIESLPSSLHYHVIDQLMRQDKSVTDVLGSLKNIEIGLGDIFDSKRKEGYPKSTPPLKQRLRLLINTSLNSAHIGDRLEKSYVFIFIPEGAHFETLESLDTKKETVTLGSEKSKTEIGTSVAASIPIPAPSTVSPQLSHKWERSFERSLQRQLTQPTVALNPQRDVLFGSLEGIEGIDPGGNLAVSVTVGLDQSQLAILSIISGKEQKAKENKTNQGEGKARYGEWQVSEEPIIQIRDLTAVVVWYVQARVIDSESSWNWVPDGVPLLGNIKYQLSGAHTVSEADDIVKPYVFSSVYPVTLWINPWQFYYIVLSDRKTGCRYLTINTAKPGQARHAAFKRFGDALKFREWLQSTSFDEMQKQFEINWDNPPPEPREQPVQPQRQSEWETRNRLEWDTDKDRLRILYKSSSDQQPSIGQENACHGEDVTS